MDFIPLRAIRNPHVMTIAANFWPRKFPRLGRSVPRLFEIEPGTQVRGECHWQQNSREHPAIVLLHGLEGSSDSSYMLGTAEKAWFAGFSVIRLNQRNCGGTEKLTPTLYHSGLSGDVGAVIRELIEQDRLPEVSAAGFSMGGNLVLKMAGEMGDSAPPQLTSIVAVAPALDLAACADALDERRNFLYQRHFVARLKRRMKHKARLFPDRYPAAKLKGLARVRSVREFDDVITAKFCGFRNADDYYAQASAKHVVAQIRCPTLILTAQDDPFVPHESFDIPAIRENPCIQLVAVRHGGHCAFIAAERAERFWAEARIVEFCARHSKISG
ncbi:MAG: YheT family hydrolase [Candidatus Acidiferrales bacterium]